MKRLICGLFAVLAVVAAQTGGAAIQVAGQLLVDVAAGDAASVGNGKRVSSWSNSKGLLGGTFDKYGSSGTGATYYDNVRGAPALWFDGTANTVLVASFTGTPPQLSGGNNTWSAEFWIMCPNISFNQGDFMSWTRRPGTGGNESMMEFRYGIDAQIGEHWGGNMPWGTKPPQGLWHHVVLTRDASKVERTYVNGGLVHTATIGNLNIRADGRMVFGATMNLDNDNFQFPYYGYIAQARIHTGVLSDVDIAQNYAAEAPLYNPTPDPDGTVFVDITAGDLNLADNAFVLSWQNNGVLAQPFVSTESAFGPTYHSDVQGAPAVLFDTSVSNVLVGASVPAQLGGNPSYTVEVWLNCPTLLTLEAAFLSWTPRGAVNGLLMEFRYYGGANSWCLGEHYNIYTRWPNNTPPAVDRWHHVVTTRDSATGDTLIYINGLPASAQVVAGLNVRSDGMFVLGGAENQARTGFQPSWGYNGYMGALRISAGVKRATDILATYNAEATAYNLTPVSNDGEWVNPVGGDWSEVTNWSPQNPVNGATKTASFLLGGGAVANDLPDLSLYGMLLGYPGTTISGNAITFADGGVIRNFEGANTVSAPLVLDGTFTTAPAAGGKVLTLSGDISGTGPLVNIGGITVLSGDNTFTGGLTNLLGTLEVNNLDALGTGPVTLGDGTFRYTGDSVTYAPSLRTEAAPNRPAAIEVTSPGTTLTLSGKFDSNAPFAKRGPGALTFAHAGDQQLNVGTSSSSAVYSYSMDGTLADGTFTFVVEEGTVTLGTAGKTTTIRNTSNAYIGTRSTTAGKSAAMYVNAGTLSLPDGSWFCINRGSLGDTAMYVSGADTRVQLGAGVVLANSEGVANHNSTALLDIDQSTFIAAGNAYIGESTTATSVANVRNGATFEANVRNAHGLSIAHATDALSSLTAEGASTVRAYHLLVNRRGTLEIKGGSRFENDFPSTAAFVHNHAVYNKGTVIFDNATFAQRTPNTIGLWLHDMPGLFVGDGGMTLDASGWALLDPALLNAQGATSAAATKTGSGTLAIRPPAVPTTSTDGTLALFGYGAISTSNLPPAVALTLDGGNIDATADGVLLNKEIVPSATDTLEFSPAGTLRFRDAWQVNGSVGFMRNDGWLRFANGSGSQAVSCFLREKQRVTGPWTASFTFFGEGVAADGFGFVVHNDARGVNALGGNGSSLGYAGGEGTCIFNSIAVLFDTYNNGRVRYGYSGLTTNLIEEVQGIPFLYRENNNMVKTFVTISYDGVSTITCVLRRADGRKESCKILDVDIASQVGGDMAYIGLTGATGGAVIQQGFLGEIIWDDGVTSAFRQDVAQYGGNVLLGDGTFNALLNNFTPLQSVSALDTLTFTDGATLNADVSCPAIESVLENQAVWKLNGGATWWDDGIIRVTPESNVNGSFFSIAQHNVADAWTAKFTYWQGNDSGTPADFFTFTAQDLSPNQLLPGDPWIIPNGLTVQWNYYDQRATSATVLRLYANGSLVSSVTGLNGIWLPNKQLTYMTIAYDPVAQTVTVTTEQPGISAAHTHVFEGVDMAAIMGPSSDGKAFVGCTGRSGGQWAEDFVSDFAFNETRSLYVAPALAFNRYDGAGTVNHQGSATLALLGDVDYAPADVTLSLNGGGLSLRRASDEPLGFVVSRGDWVGLNTRNIWEPNNGAAQLTYNTDSYVGRVVSKRRINVARDFTASFSFITTNAIADGMCFVFHNDTRDLTTLGGAGGASGYLPIQNSLALRFNIYNTNTVSLGKSGAWVGGSDRGLPFNLKNATTDVTVCYSALTKTMTVALTNAAGIGAEEVFEDVDLYALTGNSGYATAMFTAATGGSHAYQAIRNFHLRYPAPVAVTDERLMVGGTIIPEGVSQLFTLDVPTVSNPMFLIENGTFGDGSALRLVSQTAGTLRYANTTFDGAAAFDIQAGVTLVLGGSNGNATLNLSGGGNTDLSDLATGKDTRVNLSGGATISAVPKRIIGGGSLNGKKLTAGIYTPSNCDWVLAGQVNIGSLGTIILLR